jgi:methanogenic corrinoid protein MtbC1
MGNQTQDAVPPYTDLVNALISVDQPRAKELLTTPQPGTNPYHLIEERVVPALEAIGIGWENGTYSLSQVYMSGRICEEILTSYILPSLDKIHPNQPHMAIAVLEDYHLLGKRIVYSILRSSGFELANYGRMEVDALVKKVMDDQIEILLISVLMLPSALRVEKLKTELLKARSHVKIVVGGAPFRFDKNLWQTVGADASGSTAFDAVNIVRRLIGEKQ